MRYQIANEIVTFGTDGDIKCTASFHYFPKENTIKLHKPLLHNFKSIAAGIHKVEIGDVLETEDFKVTIKDTDKVRLEGKYQTDLLVVDKIETGYVDYPEYTNSPRINKQISDVKVDLERIPEKDKDTSRASLVKKLLPAIIGIVMAILMLWIRPRGIRGILMLITTLVSFAISMYTLYHDQKDSKAHNKLRKETYENYLLDKRNELALLANEERSSRNYNYLSIKEIISELDHSSSRLYERDIKDEDFLMLRLGTKVDEPTYGLDNPFEKLELRYEEADEDLKELYEEYKQLRNLPLVTDVKKNIGLVGNRYVISKQMKNILMQAIFNHSYLDLQIVIVTDETYLDDYKYTFSVNHYNTSEDERKLFIHDATSRDQYLNGFTSLLRMRDMEYKPGMQFDKHMLFIIDNPSLINNHPIMEFLEKKEERLGMSIIQVAKASNELPKHIKTVVEYKTNEKAELVLEAGTLVNKEFTLPQIDKTKEELELYYRKLSNLEHIKGIKSSVPDKLGFLEMYEVNDPKELQIANRWNANKTYKSLAALLGKKSETDSIYLDLHEKIHGPHGLVAGTTGSGKSEVIQTYILSLAIEYSPEQVGFLLIDYKGGGMANLFKDMPHHLGSITNLDGYQSMRALASIKSELKRRQQIFSDNNVNHINNYTKLYEAGQVQEPLPHLFLISDEFAELKAEQPDFMKELVSAARIGRSLGIHLILATQKPDGVVDDQIWSNSKFKLSLKVAEEADSKALLKTSDAAYITNPGRGYLKVGTNELYELFQSGYSGAPYSTSAVSTAKPEVYELDMHGNKTLLNPEECINEEEQEGIQDTELDVVLQEIDNTYKTSNLTQVSKPWLPPLENYSYVPINLATDTTRLNLEVNLGTIDLPNRQAQMDYIVNLEANGHMLICGASGMGKTFTILKTVFELVSQNTPEQLKLFSFDLGNGGLIHIKDINHSSEYFTLDFDEKQKQFCDYVKKEVSERKKKLLAHKVSSFKQYNQTSKNKMQAIVIAIDAYENIDLLEKDVADILKELIKDGAPLGIILVISSSSISSIKQNLLMNIKNILMLNTTNHQEIGIALAKTSLPSQEIPGRGFVLVDDVEVVQIHSPIILSEDTDESESISKLVSLINKNNTASNSAFALMPDTIGYKRHNLENNMVYVGHAFSTLKMAVLPFDTLHIGGINKSGKTNFVKLLIEQIKDKQKITIIDDTSYSLLEYSETENIHYTTNVDNIDVNSDVVVINKLSRFDKLKPKELNPILEKLFLMHLKGTKFILESGPKGLKAGNVDIWNAINSSHYYIHFANPVLQNKCVADKKKYEKEMFTVSEGYVITDTSINKVKIPKVITGNEEKEFIIPELKELEKEAIPDVIEAVVIGDHIEEYVNSVISKNPNTNFKLFGTKIEINQDNCELVTIDQIKKVSKDDVLIINDLVSLNTLVTKERRSAFEEIEKVDCKIVILENIEIKLSGNRLRELKKKFIVTSNPLKDEIQQLCKPMPSSVKKMKLNDGEAIKIIGKDTQKIKY